MKLIMAALAILATSAEAQTNCAPRARVIERLADQYGESRHGIGLAANRTGIAEIYVNDTSGTWSVVVTLPSGMACMVITGTNYSATTGAPVAQGDPL